MTGKPWESAKASGSEGDAAAARFVCSLDWDWRLYKHDIRGSIAHARMLEHVGLINKDELSEIERGLGEIESEIEALGANGRQWPGFKVELEDVHMCVEAALIEKVGEPGRKLHTGRSRNDQVALDTKLFIREAQQEVSARIESLREAFAKLAETDGRVVMPSYTHLQRAQPIVAGGELLAWGESFARCQDRIDRLCALHGDSPIGSGAIAGSSLPLDRAFTANVLGFDAVTRSSIDATASRDVAIDFAYGLSMTAMWLSRWAEQWIIYASAEFGFITLDNAYTTGSSMMPQKRNPDMLELIRGKCGQVYGSLVALLTLCKGITVGYNRDLQEDKRHLFSAYDCVCDSLDVAAGIVRTTRFNEERIKDGLDRGYLDATSMAEYLVTQGVAFRTAHQVVGKLVKLCDDTERYKLEQLSVEEMNATVSEVLAGITGGVGSERAASVRERGPASHASSNVVSEDVFDWLGPENVVKRYQTAGNAGVSGFEQQLEDWRAMLDDFGSSSG
ncbi:MAG: argininosuccinate lyase [Planctomycetota bacterium]